MKHFVTIISFFLFAFAANAQTKEYTFPQIGWSIFLPTDFTILDQKEITATREIGINAFEKVFDTIIDFNEVKSILSFRKGEENYFMATLTKLDAESQKKWIDVNNKTKPFILKALKSKYPAASMDSASSIQLIGGLVFEVFKLRLNDPGMFPMTCISYATLKNGHKFVMNIVYDDEKIGKKFESVCESSKFSE